MMPRIDITAVNIDTSFDELCRVVVDCGYSRIPVYDDTLDNIKGVLYVKDLLPFINKDINFRWQSLIRLPYFIPESKKINDLLNEFQQKKIHAAVVVDEYGGTSGIITLEDILEEIVGEILDESDLEEDENLYTKINDNTYLFEGKTPLNNFCKIMQVDGDLFDEKKGEAETLAGFILELKGDFPEKGESIQYQQFLFTVEEADYRRILKIKVSINYGTKE
jgi:CBS domain containing-hemolysin-like protein